MAKFSINLGPVDTATKAELGPGREIRAKAAGHRIWRCKRPKSSFPSIPGAGGGFIEPSSTALIKMRYARFPLFVLNFHYETCMRLSQSLRPKSPRKSRRRAPGKNPPGGIQSSRTFQKPQIVQWRKKKARTRQASPRKISSLRAARHEIGIGRRKRRRKLGMLFTYYRAKGRAKCK